MNETGFHFAQPAWLWGLLVLPVVAWWLWRSAARAAKAPVHRYADPQLLPHLAGSRALAGTERWGRFFAWAGLWLLLLTAMAGPRWDYTDVRLFQPGDNLLILLDISRSMATDDVAPSRLGRARQEIQDLIMQNRRLRLGLVAFASSPHVVAPVTEDSRTILLALPALATDLARLQGSRLHAALDRAEILLDSLPAESARSLLLISDGDFDESGLTERVAALADTGVVMHVLGIGTEGGGEVPGPRDSPLVGPDGKPVRSALDEDRLQALAAAGGGRYREADYRDADTRDILDAAARSKLPPQASDERTRVWHERFYLPVALLLLLLLPRFKGRARTRLPPTAQAPATPQRSAAAPRQEETA
ncbi:MAG: VWA domain-containing protein [Gammaproteobacteria bacterium]|jgi:Ca-activated chloride channel family protein|nr:VWA domain-containing protein [Gammaproteobacteria bacterium]